MHNSNLDFSDENSNFTIESIDLNVDNKAKTLDMLRNVQFFNSNKFQVNKRKFHTNVAKKKICLKRLTTI